MLGVGSVIRSGLESAIVNMPDDLSAEPTVAQSFPSRRVALGLLLIMLLAAALRARHVSEPLWVDELHTAWVVEGSLSEVAARAAAGNQGAFFYYAQWFLRSLVTPSELTYRCLSLVAGLLLVPTMFFVAREVCRSEWAGWTAAAIVSVDRFSVIFSCEARPYAWVQLMTVVHLYLGWLRLAATDQENSRANRSLRIAWIGTGALLFYLHYTAALILAAEVVAWVVLRTARPGMLKSSRGSCGIDLLMLAILCSPALPHLVVINQRRAAWSEFVPVPEILSLLTLLPLLTYIAIPLVAGLSESSRDRGVQRSFGHGVWLTMLSCSLLFPLLFTWATTVSGIAALYLPRYLVGSLTVSILIAAALVGWLRGTGWRCLTVVVLTMSVLLTESAISFSGWIPADAAWPGFLHRSGVRAKQEYWDSLIRHINTHDSAGRWAVFLVPDLIEDRQLGKPQSSPVHRRISREEFCLFPVKGCYTLRESAVPVVALASQPASLERHHLDRLRRAGGGWFMIRGRRSRVMGWQQAIEEALRKDGLDHLTRMQWFGSLGLVQLEVLSVN